MGVRVQEGESAKEGFEPEGIVLRMRDAEALRDALDRLPSSPGDIDPARVRAKSYEDIAGIMTVPIGTLMSQVGLLASNCSSHSLVNSKSPGRTKQPR
jgi:DNA-directed RNA polymerase specialized sigma24 family protein